MSVVPPDSPMFDTNPTDGLVACEECGAPRSVKGMEASETGSNMSCVRCGSDSFRELRDPSKE